MGRGDPCARMCPRPSSLKPWLLYEGCAVERREALGIAERALGLDGHGTTRLNNKPPVGGVAQIDGDVDTSRRAKPHGQRERCWIGPGGGNGAFEVHNPIDFLNRCVAGREWGVGPAVDQRKRRKPGCVRGERRTLERREALGIAEPGLGLDAHGTTGLNKKPPLRRVAEIDGKVDIGQRAKRRGQRERHRGGPRRGDCAPELHDARDFLGYRTAGAG